MRKQSANFILHHLFTTAGQTLQKVILQNASRIVYQDYLQTPFCFP